jgi:hypothetical protein
MASAADESRSGSIRSRMVIQIGFCSKRGERPADEDCRFVRGGRCPFRGHYGDRRRSREGRPGVHQSMDSHYGARPIARPSSVIFSPASIAMLSAWSPSTRPRAGRGTYPRTSRARCSNGHSTRTTISLMTPSGAGRVAPRGAQPLQIQTASAYTLSAFTTDKARAKMGRAYPVTSKES